MPAMPSAQFALDLVIVATLLAVYVWLLVKALAQINQIYGAFSNRAWVWYFFVIAGNLFGILLFRFCRDMADRVFDTMFERQ